MKIKQIMDRSVVRMDEDRTLAEAVELMAVSRVSDIAVTDKHLNYKGVVSAGDLIMEIFPDFHQVLKDHDSLDKALDVFVKNAKQVDDVPISYNLIKPSFTVKPDDDVLSAVKIMIEKMIKILPVVDNGRLIGSIARESLCWALLN